MLKSNERSAEWLRIGMEAMEVYRETHETWEEMYARYERLLAAAEAREAAQPKAAEVIEAAEKALERLLPWALQAGANAEDALALCARWEEANGGK